MLNDCAAAVRCPSMALPTHIMCVVWMRDSDDSNASNEDDGATRTLPLPLTLTLLELVSACTCEVPNPRPTLATLLPSSPRRPVFYCTPPPKTHYHSTTSTATLATCMGARVTTRPLTAASFSRPAEGRAGGGRGATGGGWGRGDVALA